MSRFSEEFDVIPRPAKVLAILPVLIVPCLMFIFLSVTNRHGEIGRLPFVFLIGLVIMLAVSTYVLLIGYIAGDARRRGMRPLLWILLAIFIPNAIGIILYFILRDPILRHCPKCGAGSNPAFVFCSICGAALSKTCPACRNTIQPGWTHCARCGASLPLVPEVGN